MNAAGRSSGVAGQAVLITATRLANQGLLILSPIVLVHLLSVEEFGRYREFLLYAGILISIGAFGINNSLLYFVPARPVHTQLFVKQAVLLTAANSLLTVAATVALNAVFKGALVGEYAWPLAAYVLLFVNLDFWEYLWLARKRSVAVFAYTSGRLLARMTVVILAAWLWRDAHATIGALIGLEALRFAGSLAAWRMSSRASHSDAPVRGNAESPKELWREQLQFCMPLGASLLLVVGNKSLGGLLVAKFMGPVALAQYAIGTYVQPIITVLRNSISDVLLPEMVGRGTEADRLALWRRATVIFSILLIPTGILLARFAELIVVTLFSEQYQPAVLLFQVYLLTLLRECFDFGVPLRAIGNTTPIVHSNLIALVLNLALTALLLPRLGLVGAVIAFVISRFVEGAYLGARMLRLYGVRLANLAPWADLAKVAAAAVTAAAVLWSPLWSALPGLAGMAVAAFSFGAVFAVVLCVLRVREAMLLLRRIWRPLAI